MSANASDDNVLVVISRKELSRRVTFRSFLSLSMLVCLFILAGFGNQGCNGKSPSQSSVVATATPTLAPNVISNLENDSLALNAVSFPQGTWYASTWGDPGNKVNPNWVTCGGVGANGTDCAVHLFGLLTDNSDGQYPSFQLECILGSGYFDASRFAGVRFDYKFGTDDNPLPPNLGIGEVSCSPYRRFNLVIAATQQDIKGGTCPSDCFDHFGLSLNATNDAWVPKSCIFSTMTKSFDGTPHNLTVLHPDDLKQVIELQWQVGRNGHKGRYTVDYWVDEVEFF